MSEVGGPFQNLSQGPLVKQILFDAAVLAAGGGSRSAVPFVVPSPSQHLRGSSRESQGPESNLKGRDAFIHPHDFIAEEQRVRESMAYLGSYN